jgi:hypothetical protein
MGNAPKAVVHINFLPTVLYFDARPIWGAVIKASDEGRLPADAMQRISGLWGNTAIHLAMRDAIMRRAVRELKEGMAIRAISGGRGSSRRGGGVRGWQFCRSGPASAESVFADCDSQP